MFRTSLCRDMVGRARRRLQIRSNTAKSQSTPDSHVQTRFCRRTATRTFPPSRLSSSLLTQQQTFSSTPGRSYDLAKLVLVGRLGKDPELRTTKNDKEYVSSVLLSLLFSSLTLSQVQRCNIQLPPSSPSSRWQYVFILYMLMHSLHMGPLARVENGVTWHHIVSFNPTQNNYLRTLSKGSRVYVEANYELRDPDPNADSSSPSGQRQIFLRHGALLLSRSRRCLSYLVEAIRVLTTPYQQDTETSSDQV